MDPNEALRQLRSEIATLSVAIGEGHPLWPIVEHFTALDGWLSRGGFPPAAWLGAGESLAAALRLATPGTHEPLGPPNPAHGHLPEHGDG